MNPYKTVPYNGSDKVGISDIQPRFWRSSVPYIKLLFIEQIHVYKEGSQIWALSSGFGEILRGSTLFLSCLNILLNPTLFTIWLGLFKTVIERLLTKTLDGAEKVSYLFERLVSWETMALGYQQHNFN